MCMLKCSVCPYKLGIIKCVVNPCIECRMRNSSEHPFPDIKIIHENKQCPDCGSNHFIGNKCAVCGKKIKILP